MLACYCLQGKQLASGVIDRSTNQSHYNVCGINTTPCARLLLRHPLAQRIPTEPCECSVSDIVGGSFFLLLIAADEALTVDPLSSGCFHKSMQMFVIHRQSAGMLLLTVLAHAPCVFHLCIVPACLRCVRPVCSVYSKVPTTYLLSVVSYSLLLA